VCHEKVKIEFVFDTRRLFGRLERAMTTKFILNIAKSNMACSIHLWNPVLNFSSEPIFIFYFHFDDAM